MTTIIPLREHTQVSSVLDNPLVSVDRKMEAISQALLANAELIATLCKQYNDCRGLCHSLAAKNGIVQNELASLQQSGQQTDERVSALSAWKEKRSAERKQEIAEQASELGRSVAAKRTLNTVTSRTLNLLSIYLLAYPPQVIVGAAIAVNVPARLIEQNLKKEAWILKNFPEAVKSAEVKAKALKIFEAIVKEESIHDSMYYHATKPNDEDDYNYEPGPSFDDTDERPPVIDSGNVLLSMENSRHWNAMQRIEEEMAALRATLDREFY